MPPLSNRETHTELDRVLSLLDTPLVPVVFPAFDAHLKTRTRSLRDAREEVLAQRETICGKLENFERYLNHLERLVDQLIAHRTVLEHLKARRFDSLDSAVIELLHRSGHRLETGGKREPDKSYIALVNQFEKLAPLTLPALCSLGEKHFSRLDSISQLLAQAAELGGPDGRNCFQAAAVELPEAFEGLKSEQAESLQCLRSVLGRMRESCAKVRVSWLEAARIIPGDKLRSLAGENMARLEKLLDQQAAARRSPIRVEGSIDCALLDAGWRLLNDPPHAAPGFNRIWALLQRHPIEDLPAALKRLDQRGAWGDINGKLKVHAAVTDLLREFNERCKFFEQRCGLDSSNAQRLAQKMDPSVFVQCRDIISSSGLSSRLIGPIFDALPITPDYPPADLRTLMQALMEYRRDTRVRLRDGELNPVLNPAAFTSLASIERARSALADKNGRRSAKTGEESRLWICRYQVKRMLARGGPKIHQEMPLAAADPRRTAAVALAAIKANIACAASESDSDRNGAKGRLKFADEGRRSLRTSAYRKDLEPATIWEVLRELEIAGVFLPRKRAIANYRLADARPDHHYRSYPLRRVLHLMMRAFARIHEDKRLQTRLQTIARRAKTESEPKLPALPPAAPMPPPEQLVKAPEPRPQQTEAALLATAATELHRALNGLIQRQESFKKAVQILKDWRERDYNASYEKLTHSSPAFAGYIRARWTPNFLKLGTRQRGRVGDFKLLKGHWEQEKVVPAFNECKGAIQELYVNGERFLQQVDRVRAEHIHVDRYDDIYRALAPTLQDFKAVYQEMREGRPRISSMNFALLNALAQPNSAQMQELERIEAQLPAACIGGAQ